MHVVKVVRRGYLGCQEAGNHHGLLLACGKIRLTECLTANSQDGAHLCCSWMPQSLQQTKLKFYALPTAKKVLQVWLSLIGRHLSEVSFHSRICSEHFDGKKTKDSIPEIYPWQRSSAITTGPTVSSTSQDNLSIWESSVTPKHRPSPIDIVRQDHSYCTSLSSYPASTELAPITTMEPSVLLSSSIIHEGTQTTPPPFCIEDIADNNDLILFYTGFNNYGRLIICYEKSNFWEHQSIT